MLHRFVFLKKSRLQFQSICDYLCQEFGAKTAEKFTDEVEQRVTMLMKYPESGHPEPVDSKYQYRSKIVGKYNKMYFYVRGNTLVIAAFTDMRMHPNNIRKTLEG